MISGISITIRMNSLDKKHSAGVVSAANPGTKRVFKVTGLK